MSLYRELDPMIEHRIQFASKTRDSILLVLTYQAWHIQANILTSKYRRAQKIVWLYQIPSKFSLTLTLHQQTRHAVL